MHRWWQFSSSEAEQAAPIVDLVGRLVVQPDATGGEIAEPVLPRRQLHGHRPGAVAAGDQLVPAGLPAVEATDDAHRPGRSVPGQAEGHPGLVAEEFVALDHVI